jgi:D-threo-aldose 1-dehydrogenase
MIHLVKSVSDKKNMHNNLKEQKTGAVLMDFPPVIFGTSSLGNLYQSIPYQTKLSLVSECVANATTIPVFDTAGKYGAGLSLQALGQCLRDLSVQPNEVVISNKLGWFQVPLTAPEPTFEKGIWKDIYHDAIQKISYNGILECFYQGNELLGSYVPQMVSVHDPDEYLAKAENQAEADKLYNDILEAYKALADLKAAGKVTAIGVASKQWKVIQRIVNDVTLDWVMVANNLTLHSHPKDLIDFIAVLHKKGVSVINSAVFNGGFLIGSDHYNYAPVDITTEQGASLYKWRDGFFALCREFAVQPAEACFSFGFNVPGIKSVALNTTRPEKVKTNIEMVTKAIPFGFWSTMVERGLLKKISF